MPERIVGDLSPGSVLLAGPANGLGERLAAGGAEVDAAGLTEPPARRYDLAVRVGGPEQLPEAELDNLCAASDRVLLAPAGPELAAALAARGYLRELERDYSAIAPGAALFVRAEQPAAAELARRYEGALSARDEELRRLRDLLVAKDEEIGEARGHAAEMEAHAQFLIGIARRIQLRSPGLLRILGKVLRRLRRLAGPR